MIYSDVLNREGEEKRLVKSMIIKPGENVEVETLMEFLAPRTKGETLFKAVVMDNGSLKLKGMIKIGKKAQGVEAFLKQSVLLVGTNSRAEAIPELEIESNEVKASHAASVGRIDEEQLFYLESRGLSRAEAEKEIIKAFLQI